MRRTLPFLMLLVTLLLTACAQAAPAGETTVPPTAAPVEATTAAPTAAPPTAAAGMDDPTAEPDEAIAEPDSSGMFADEDVRQMLNTLSGSSTGNPFIVLDDIVQSGDERFIPVLIELMRAAQIGLVGESLYPATIEALEELVRAGVRRRLARLGGVVRRDRPRLRRPASLAGRGHCWRAIDPRFADFLQDDFPRASGRKRFSGAVCASTASRRWTTRRC